MEEKSRGMVSSSSCYSEMGGLVSESSDMFHVNNLSTSNMDVNMIGFSKTHHLHHHHQLLWKQQQQEEEEALKGVDFTCGMSETTTMMIQHDDCGGGTWQHHVFGCQGNERPSQGLSLSLSSTNPLSIGLQSFQLTHHPHFVVKNSKYLAAAQGLLNELCSLQGSKQRDDHHQKKKKKKEHEVGCVEFVELQKRKTKLLSMLEEVERRYRQYRNQMKGVVAAFEGVAGEGAAGVYSALAVKAISRHFRSVKDEIVGEIEGIRRRMGEKDHVAPGTTKGETPRLKIIDQALRQHRAFQQMSMMESHPWRPQRGLPDRSVSLLRAWLFEHFLHPYPSDMDKHILARQTGLSRTQVSNWFINARVRLWKPMVEEMYMEELKEQEDKDTNNNMGNSSEGVSDHQEKMMTMIDNNNNNNNSGTASDDPNINDDEKPMQQVHRLLRRMDSECTVSSSIINHNKNDSKNHHHYYKHNNNNMLHHYNSSNSNPHNEQEGSAFGSVELDFSSCYGQHHSSGGVSLTLGLQQQEGGSSSGVSLAFPPPNQASLDLFYPTLRDQIQMDDSAQPPNSSLHYSLLDPQQHNINLPYTNLMGAQLLRDLTG